jgi:hypothetical protein
MKQKQIFAVTTILLVLVGSLVITSYTVFNRNKVSTGNSFYVGVTYCGESVQEAKELIDKVKNYTNLFTLQTGTITFTSMIEEIGDYAVAANLSFAVYNSKKFHVSYDTSDSRRPLSVEGELNNWTNTVKNRWGEQFIGYITMMNQEETCLTDLHL